MSVFNKSVETILQESIARGEFDNLPNMGKKIDLTDYFNTPKEMRVSSSVLKSAGIKPPEIELLRQIADLKNQLASCEDNAKQAKIHARIEILQIEFNMAIERIQQQRGK